MHWLTIWWCVALGGFKISFFTDNIQGTMVMALVVIATISIGVETKIDTSLIEESGLLKGNLLGWQLVYILPVALLTNSFFLVGASVASVLWLLSLRCPTVCFKMPIHQ